MTATHMRPLFAHLLCAAVLATLAASAGAKTVVNQTPSRCTSSVSYPAEAKELGHQGTTRMLVRIGISGKVKGVKIVGTSGYPQLDASAMRWIKGCRFNPTIKDGKAVEATLYMPVEFRISQ